MHLKRLSAKWQPFCSGLNELSLTLWALIQYKDHLSSYMDYHYKDETVMRLSYHHNGNPYTKKDSLSIEMPPW